MDNKQEQNIDFDKLLGATQEDTKIDFGDSKVSDLDGFMQDEPVMEFAPLVDESSNVEDDFVDETENVDPVADFNDFKLEDLDSALKSFQEARSGKVSSIRENPPKISEKNETEEIVDQEDINTDVLYPAEAIAEDVSISEVQDPVVDPSDVDMHDETENNKDEPVEDEQMLEENSHRASLSMNPMVIGEKDAKLQGITEESADILRWYSGKIDDKTYELSVDNMPEFLNTDRTIRVIYVSVASAYGWNVFFDNGIFMNLQDLQTYQTRHGKMPYNSGKIVYGNKTTQFENINRIVVYELPRYFSYKPE